MNWIQSLAGTAALIVGVGALGSASTPDAHPESPRDAPVRLEVDISERKLYVHHGGSVMNTFEIAVGEEPEHPTPRGSFTIDRIIWNPAWVPPATEWAEDESRKAPDDPDNPMVGAKLFFKYPDYYIHGTDATHTLGDAASHGCIRMEPSAVLELARFVQEHGGASQSEAWYDRVGRDDGSKHEIALPDAVPIEIHD